MAELSVQIGADIKDLQKKLAGAIKGLDALKSRNKELTKAFKDGTISSDRYYKLIARNTLNIKKASTGLNSLKNSVSDGSKEMDKFGKSTANAVPATQEFSRIIQDAPFGIQGVANNITQLTDQFGNLTRKTGSSGAALKAMLGTLSGPAGILLAVSAVTSLMVSYGDELLKSTSATKEISKATAEFEGAAKAEITTLSQLVSIAKDEANSKTVRQGAIEEINEKYSKYLGNLDLESIKTDAVTKSVKKLTEALVLKAKISGLDALITEKTADGAEDILEAEARRSENLKTLNSQVEKAIVGNFELNRALKDVKGSKDRTRAFIELTKKQGTLGDVARQAGLSVASSLNSFNNASKEVKELNKNLDDTIAPFVTLQEKFKKGLFQKEGEIVDVDANAVVINVDKDSLDKSRKEQIKNAAKIAESKRKLFAKIDSDILKDEEQARNEFIKAWEKIDINVDPFDGDILNIEEGFRDIKLVENKIKDLQKLLSSLGANDINLEGLNLDQLTVFENKLTSSLEKSNVFSDGVSGAFNALSGELTKNLQTGNAILDAFTGAIIQSLSQIAIAGIQALIAEQTIATAKNGINRSVSSGNAITVATSAAAALGPLGVPALPGLIASQLALVNGAFAGVGAFAKGSGGFSGDNALAYLNRNEMILRPMEQSALYNAIRGHNLSSLSNNSTSSSLSDGILGEVVLRGDKQVIQVRRASKKMKRFQNS